MTLAAGIAGGGSLTVPGPTSPAPQPPAVETPTPVVQTATPLPASFREAPAAHDGEEPFAFDITFGKAVEGLKLAALKQAVAQALSVTGGRLVDVKRTYRGQNRRVTVRVRPSSSGEVTLTLAGTIGDGTLANPLSLTVPGPSAQPVSPPDQEPAHASLVEGKVVKTPPPPPPPEEAKQVSKSITSDHPGLGDITSSVVKMNSFGVWGSHPFISTQGGSVPNNAPDFEVRNHKLPGPLFATVNGVRMGAAGNWYSYPSTQGTSKMKAYVFISRFGYGTYSSPGKGGKSDLVAWMNDGGPDVEPFSVTTRLAAPGTAAQPTAATWTGHVIAAETSSDVIRRGELIGGDASVTVTVSGGSTLAEISLTNLEATTLTTGSPLVPVSYADQTWTGVGVSGGSFSQSGTGTGVYREIEGTFRKQNNDGDVNTDIVDTVGAKFEVRGTMKGGFVATR